MPPLDGVAVVCGGGRLALAITIPLGTDHQLHLAAMTIDELSQWERVVRGLSPLDPSNDAAEHASSVRSLHVQLSGPIAACTDDG